MAFEQGSRGPRGAITGEDNNRSREEPTGPKERGSEPRRAGVAGSQPRDRPRDGLKAGQRVAPGVRAGGAARQILLNLPVELLKVFKCAVFQLRRCDDPGHRALLFVSEAPTIRAFPCGPGHTIASGKARHGRGGTAEKTRTGEPGKERPGAKHPRLNAGRRESEGSGRSGGRATRQNKSHHALQQNGPSRPAEMHGILDITNTMLITIRYSGEIRDI